MTHAGTRLSGRENNYSRQRAEVLLPLGGRGDQVAVAVAGDDVGKHDLRQRAFLVQACSRALDLAVDFQFFQDFFQKDLVVAANAEGAGDLALADLCGRRLPRRRALAGDKGENVLAGRHGGLSGG